MEKIELQLDEKTLERAQRLAESRHCTLEQLIKEVLEHLAVVEAVNDPFLGMFAHEPELIDQVIESAMSAREEYPPHPSTGLRFEAG